MLEGLQKVIGRKGPKESIRAISEAYLRFAHERPYAFALYLKIRIRNLQVHRKTNFS